MRSAILVLVLCLFAAPALAETPAQFAAPGVRAPDDPHVNGFRFSFLYGEAERVRGLDLGLLSLSETGSFEGFSSITGISRVTRSMNGVSGAVVNIHSGKDRGLNAAFINVIHTLETGLNVAFINVSEAYTMFDLGGANVGRKARVQVGFINSAQELSGFQFGFLNIAQNGFLPVFPVFNFPKPATRSR